jgi:hypothetical protein
MMDAAGPTQADVSVHLRKSGGADAIDTRHGQGNNLTAKIQFISVRSSRQMSLHSGRKWLTAES